MSTPEEPPQLTRRQLRELRNTAATPIITEATSGPESTDASDSPALAEQSDSPEQSDAPEQSDTPEQPMAPLAREAAPITLPDAPVEPEPPHADTEEHRSLTRREIRQRERLRTASVPVITSEVLAATRVSEEPEAASHDESPAGLADEDDVIHAEVVTDAIPATPTEDDWSAPHDDAHDGSPAEPAWSAPVAPVEATSEVSSDIDATADASSGSESLADSAQPSDADTSGQPESEPAAQGESAGEATTEADRRVVAPTLGSDLLDGHAQNVEVPASFDQLLTRGIATGALSMPNALILSQTPEGDP